MDTAFDRKIVGLRLSTGLSDDVLNERMYSHGRKEIRWLFEFKPKRYDSSTPTSSFWFKDEFGVTQRLLAELYQETRLSKVYELKVNKLEILLDHSYDPKRVRHILYVHGHGYHSSVDMNKSNFTMECTANETMVGCINTLLEMVTKDIQ